MNLRISILDNHAMFAQTLAYYLEHELQRLQVISQCQDAVQLFDSITNDRIDLVLLELNIANRDGLDIIKDIKKDSHPPKIIVISAYRDPKFVRRAMIGGADGFLYKGNTLDELPHAITGVFKEQTYMGEGVRASPKSQLSDTAMNQVTDTFVMRQRLTKRELEILENIAKGKNNREIGKELFISYQTVGVHRKNIMKKLGVRNTLSLVKLAYEKELV